MLFQKIFWFHGVLATSILLYISNSFADERFDNNINAPLSIIEANESAADILDLLSIVFPERVNKNLENQQDVEPIHSRNSSAPLVKVVNEPGTSFDLEKIEPNLEIKLSQVKVTLNPFNFEINAKTIGTDLIYKDKIIKLERIRSKISLKSYINNDFAVKGIFISTKSLAIKDLITFARLINNDPKILHKNHSF